MVANLAIISCKGKIGSGMTMTAIMLAYAISKQTSKSVKFNPLVGSYKVTSSEEFFNLIESQYKED